MRTCLMLKTRIFIGFVNLHFVKRFSLENDEKQTLSTQQIIENFILIEIRTFKAQLPLNVRI